MTIENKIPNISPLKVLFFPNMTLPVMYLSIGVLKIFIFFTITGAILAKYAGRMKYKQLNIKIVKDSGIIITFIFLFKNFIKKYYQ